MEDEDDKEDKEGKEEAIREEKDEVYAQDDSDIVMFHD